MNEINIDNSEGLKCLICNSGKLKKIAINDSFGVDIVECSTCKFMQTQYISARTLQVYYEKFYLHMNDEQLKNYENQQIQKGIAQVNYIKEVCGNINFKNVLDYGASLGGSAQNLRSISKEVYVLEYNKKYIEILKKKGFVIIENDDELFSSKYKGFFDFVNLSHVLEHIPDPIKLMENLSFILKDNGYLLVELPNELQLLKGYNFQARGHLHYFTMYSFKNMIDILKKFELLEIRTCNRTVEEFIASGFTLPEDYLREKSENGTAIRSMLRNLKNSNNKSKRTNDTYINSAKLLDQYSYQLFQLNNENISLKLELEKIKNKKQNLNITKEKSLIYLILPTGNMHGWGICSKYLVKELKKIADVKFITEPFKLSDIGNEIDFQLLDKALINPKEAQLIQTGDLTDVKKPILQAITSWELNPYLLKLKGSFKVGYTFFAMSKLDAQYIQNGKDNFDMIITGSTWCEKVLRNHGLSNVKTIIQGIDPQMFNSWGCEKEFFEDNFVIFSGGKFELRKGQDIVIKAFKVMCDRHKDVLLINSWVNLWTSSLLTMKSSPYIKFDNTSKTYEETINKVLSDNEIDLNRVITLGARSNDQMARIYKNTDIGLFPNRCEGGTNLVLMEYMACGKPAIASYNSGHIDILTEHNCLMLKKMKPLNIQQNNTTGAVWDEPDLDEVIENLEYAYKNRDSIKKIGQRAGVDLSKLTWEKTAKEFFDVLKFGL